MLNFRHLLFAVWLNLRYREAIATGPWLDIPEHRELFLLRFVRNPKSLH